jgi:Tfp pilus assembly protein PilV
MRGSNKQRGFILHEAIMAVAMSMLLVVGIAQLLSTVLQQRRLARQHAVATQEVGNLMEDVVSRDWAKTTQDDLASVALSEACRTCLPDAALSVDVADEDADVRRIRVKIEWQDVSGQATQNVCLVGWKHRSGEAGS